MRMEYFAHVFISRIPHTRHVNDGIRAGSPEQTRQPYWGNTDFIKYNSAGIVTESSLAKSSYV
jgi:hypothetical protein